MLLEGDNLYFEDFLLFSRLLLVIAPSESSRANKRKQWSIIISMVQIATIDEMKLSINCSNLS